MNGIMKNRIVLDVPTSPLGILNKKIELESSADTKTLFYRLDEAGLYSMFLMACIMIGAIMITGALIMLLFYKKKEVIAEKKATIYHNLFLIFLSNGGLFFFNALLMVGNSFIVQGG